MPFCSRKSTTLSPEFTGPGESVSICWLRRGGFRLPSLSKEALARRRAARLRPHLPGLTAATAGQELGRLARLMQQPVTRCPHRTVDDCGHERSATPSAGAALRRPPDGSSSLSIRAWSIGRHTRRTPISHRRRHSATASRIPIMFLGVFWRSPSTPSPRCNGAGSNDVHAPNAAAAPALILASQFLEHG